jgi:ADP-heptose:LPS heptosyltransferase
VYLLTHAPGAQGTLAAFSAPRHGGTAVCTAWFSQTRRRIDPYQVLGTDRDLCRTLEHARSARRRRGGHACADRERSGPPRRGGCIVPEPDYDISAEAKEDATVVAYYGKLPVLLARLLGALLLPVLRAAGAVLFRRTGNEPVKILIQEGYRLGDILLCSPALLHLRRTFPQARIHLLTFATGAELIAHAPWVDRSVTLKPFWAFKVSPVFAVREWLRVVRLLRRERYDLAIDLRGDPRGLSLVYFAGIPRRISFGDFGGSCFCTRAYRTPGHITHQMIRCCLLAEKVGGTAAGGCVRPHWPPQPHTTKSPVAPTADFSPSPDGLSQPVLVHPGSSVAGKFWPPERFAELIDELMRRGIDCALVGARADTEQLRALHGLLHLQCPAFLPGFAELEKLLTAASCLVCVDSFAQHAAWALGVRCVILYGPGDPLRTAPLCGPARVVWNDRVLQPPYAEWRGPRPMSRNRVTTVLGAVIEGRS